MENVTFIVFFIVCKIYCLSVGFKENIKYAEKGTASAMEFSDVAAFTFAL